MSKLVDLRTINSTFVFDIRYATPYNFTKQQLYPFPGCFLIKEAALALNHAQHELQKNNLGLKIWDGYRPLSVQHTMWKLVPDERYVGDPSLGSNHNRGTAVDCTLVTQDGNELDMGTDFDDFSQKSHLDYQDLSPEIKNNRTILQKIMVKYHFVGLSTEWWHFNYTKSQSYDILNKSFEELSLL